ncbi:MAG: peptide deformylase [Actinomycetota bacterium]
MAVRSVVRYPALVLKTSAAPIEPGDAAELCADLVDTMRASPACVGLAAPQIGVGARAFCMDVTGHPKATSSHGLVVLLDPVVVAREGTAVAREGCMSLPDFTGNVRRAQVVTVRGVTPDGGERVITADAFEARALQHEIDHLDGLLFLDRVASLTTDLFRRKRYR